jgi:hypothetical protein
LPQHLQKATSELVSQNTPDSFFRRREIIKGFILGFGQFNKDARPLILSLDK